jgi:hypothetical protein
MNTHDGETIVYPPIIELWSSDDEGGQLLCPGTRIQTVRTHIYDVEQMKI